MSLPLYGMEAHGGQIITMDDESVMNDQADDAGAGGSAIVPYIVSSIFDLGIGGGHGTGAEVQIGGTSGRDPGCAGTFVEKGFLPEGAYGGRLPEQGGDLRCHVGGLLVG